MRLGALAMFDALGFRGIWNRAGVREDPDLPISKLLKLEDKMNAMLDQEFGGGRSTAIADDRNVLGQCSLAFLSDTVVLGLATKPAAELAERGIREESYRGWSLLVACRFANMIIRESASSSPELAYRGCITYGEFALEKSFIVGPAVDEAAGLMNRAQGAFVWLSPAAQKLLKACQRSPQSLRQHGLFPYPVPLKGGDEYQTHVIFPFEVDAPREARDALAAKILATFDGSVDVEVKRQRTAEFLRAASDALDEK